MERQAAGEIGELLAQNQSSAVQSGLERLIFDVQHRAGFFRRHALDVPQHHRRAVNRRQRQNRAVHAAAQLEPQDAFVRHLRPIGRLAAELQLPLTAIGTIEMGEGVSLIDAGGSAIPLAAGGYRHF